MTPQEAAKPLLWVGLVGLAATIVFTIWMGPSSAASLEKRVQAAADNSLQTAQFTWATARARGQAVALEGAAPSDAAKQGARAAVLGALGAGGLMAGGVTKVSDARVDVAPPIKPYTWGAQKEPGGALALEGHAPNRAVLARIEETARKLYGDKVASRMSLASGAPDGVDWEKAATAGLQALQNLDRGAAELRDNRLVVTGLASSDAIVEGVSSILAKAGNGVSVASEVVGPAEWTAKLNAGKLVISGKIASADAQARLAKAAAAAFKGTAVEDSSRIGATGSWQPRVAAALPWFAKFQSGEISVQGTTIRISGEAPGSVLGYLKEDMGRIRDNFIVTYAVREVAPTVAEIEDVNLRATGAAQQQACQTAFTRIMARNQILFDSNKARISRQSGDVLDKLIAVAQPCADLRIDIQGYTDATGNRAKNIALSRDRAEAVRAYFVEHGIPADHLTATGFGPDKPAASNRTAKGRAQNRRIEFKVTSAETP
jgi:OOP family OmpA-OmpF porin